MKTIWGTLLILVGASAVVLLGWWWASSSGSENAHVYGELDADDGGPGGTVTVLAAASLTDAFEDLADRLSDEHLGLDIVVSFGPSSSLTEQVLAGAPADILATANTATMDTVVSAGAVDGDAQIFAENTLVLAVPPGNPGDVTGLTDLARDELRVAICEPQVPCGTASGELLSMAAVDAEPDTLTTDVREALALVTLGEADAALVYRTDAIAAGDAVEAIDVGDAATVVNEYPVALLSDAPNPGAARLVFDAITGGLGRSALDAAGFLSP